MPIVTSGQYFAQSGFDVGGGGSNHARLVGQNTAAFRLHDCMIGANLTRSVPKKRSLTSVEI